jgi:hypothetical protein
MRMRPSNFITDPLFLEQYMTPKLQFRSVNLYVHTHKIYVYVYLFILFFLKKKASADVYIEKVLMEMIVYY